MITNLVEEIAACRLCKDRFAATETAHEPRPVPWLSTRAPILIAGQAPGMRVHKSGKPFDDASGDRLRDWLGIDRDVFYNTDKVAILPMAFCFPGYDAKGSDLPPPKICAETWRNRAMEAMPQVGLKVLVGGYALNWHLRAKGVTQTVQRWKDFVPNAVPLPHPSWRNTGWLKKHPWFEEDILPWLRGRVAELIG